MSSPPPSDPLPRAVESPEDRSRVEDARGVDVTLIRWMLSLTPAQRLEVLQRHVDAVQRMRSRAADGSSR